MKRLITFCIISFGMLTASMAAEKQPTDYVNPFIGTTNFGTTNPGAVCPNGMMSVVPFNVMGSEDNIPLGQTAPGFVVPRWDAGIPLPGPRRSSTGG